ncbi:MAG: Stp1/IreP family PP2C-type Ser/Thr phosphatase [Lachnospiraceae bacterium]
MKAVYRTDVGRMRQQNQDSVLVMETPVGKLPNLLIVADGMGGHRAGDRASRTLVERLPRLIADSVHTNPLLIVTDAVREVNTEIYTLSNDTEEYRGMGTTLTLGYIDRRELYVFQVGDSRAYVFSGGHLGQVTRDHSYVEEMVRKGAMSRGSGEYQKKKNIITRAVGGQDFIVSDIFRVTLEPDDIVLLCSDGLTNEVTDGEIGSILSGESDLDRKADELVALANIHGGKDNISVILAAPGLR